MGKNTENSTDKTSLEKELNQYWYCPKDGNVLQIYHSPRVQSPYFDIYRSDVEIGINNAVASKRIPSEAIEQTQTLVDLILHRNPTVECVELISVVCTSCGKGSAAPKLKRVEGMAKTQAQALFESHQALKTKTFGPFRFIDRYGVGQYLQRGRDRGTGSNRWLFYMLFLGIRTIAMVLILYYIMGLEIKIGKKWIPLGIILLILSGIGIIYLIVNSPILQGIIRGYN